MWGWVGALGFGMNVVGAVWLIWVAVHEVLEKDLQPAWRTRARGVATWVRHPRFRRKTSNDAQGRILNVHIPISVSVEAAPWEGRVKSLERSVEWLTTRVQDLRSELQSQSAAATQREERDRATAARVEADVKDQELWGLLVVAVGTALQGASMYLG